MTGARGEVWDARHVVSDSWTAWHLFGFRHVDPAGVGFGAAAAWVVPIAAANDVCGRQARLRISANGSARLAVMPTSL